MDIPPITNLPRIVESTGRHEDRRQRQKRQQERKQEKVAPVPVYTPDGQLEEEPTSKIDIVG
jgi:hypothetical protein